MKCPKCGHENKEGADHCDLCKEVLHPSQKNLIIPTKIDKTPVALPNRFFLWDYSLLSGIISIYILFILTVYYIQSSPFIAPGLLFASLLLIALSLKVASDFCLSMTGSIEKVWRGFFIFNLIIASGFVFFILFILKGTFAEKVLYWFLIIRMALIVISIANLVFFLIVLLQILVLTKRTRFITLAFLIPLALLMLLNFIIDTPSRCVSKFVWALQEGHTAGEKRKRFTDADGNSYVSYNRTVLMAAAEKGRADILRRLIDKGANLNAKDQVYGQTALMLAAASGHLDILRLLIDKGADVNVKDNGAGMTALLWASYRGYVDAVKLLIEKGANVNARDTNGATALWLAYSEDHRDVAKLLIDKGADVNARDESRNTTLKYAKCRGDADMINLLKAHGAKE